MIRDSIRILHQRNSIFCTVRKSLVKRQDIRYNKKGIGKRIKLTRAPRLLRRTDGFQTCQLEPTLIDPIRTIIFSTKKKKIDSAIRIYYLSREKAKKKVNQVLRKAGLV